MRISNCLLAGSTSDNPLLTPQRGDSGVRAAQEQKKETNKLRNLRINEREIAFVPCFQSLYLSLAYMLILNQQIIGLL